MYMHVAVHGGSISMHIHTITLQVNMSYDTCTDICRSVVLIPYMGIAYIWVLVSFLQSGCGIKRML